MTPAGVRPEAFSEYTTPELWDDEHISAQMLRFHLDPVAEPASRAHAFIDSSVEWLIPILGLGHRTQAPTRPGLIPSCASSSTGT